MQTATTPDLTAQWFQRNYATMATLAGVLLAIFLFFATVQGLLANRPSMILRAYLLHAPLAALGTVLAIALVSRGLQATDAMSTAVSAHLQHDVTRVAERVGEAVVAASRVTGDGSLFVAFLGALVAVVVAVILWLELLIRQAISGRWMDGGMRMASRRGPTSPPGGGGGARRMPRAGTAGAAVSVAPWAGAAAAAASSVRGVARTAASTATGQTNAPQATRPRGGPRPPAMDSAPPRTPRPPETGHE